MRPEESGREQTESLHHFGFEIIYQDVTWRGHLCLRGRPLEYEESLLSGISEVAATQSDDEARLSVRLIFSQSPHARRSELGWLTLPGSVSGLLMISRGCAFHPFGGRRAMQNCLDVVVRFSSLRGLNRAR
jgi:hypothetical protein